MTIKLEKIRELIESVRDFIHADSSMRNYGGSIEHYQAVCAWHYRAYSKMKLILAEIEAEDASFSRSNMDREYVLNLAKEIALSQEQLTAEQIIEILKAQG